MLLKAYGKLSEFKSLADMPEEMVSKYSNERVPTLPKDIKLMRGDCLDMTDMFEDDSFDCVVNTMTLNSCYNRERLASEMKRVCRPGGYILIMERGQSYISIYNMYL